MHDLGTGVPRRLGVARSASRPKAAQALGRSPTPGLRISFGRVTCRARAASVPGLWTLGFLLLCGGCVWVWVVLGLGLRLRPATPGWGDGVCVCLRARSACTPPLLAGVCGVGVCAWAWVSAAPRHSWLGCWGVCVFVCALLLYHASPRSGVRCGCVCLGSGFGCAPQLQAGVCSVCVCVLGLGFRLRAATAGWGVGVCVCLCVRSACTSPLLSRACCVGVCAWARVSASPRHSWLGCWAVPVCVHAPRVPRHSWLGCAVWACVPGLGFWLRPATPGWAVRCGCVCMGSGFGYAPPLLAGGLWCVCACVCAQLVPRHSRLACAVWVCVLGLGFQLRPASPGWGVGVLCVFVCALRLYPATPGWRVRCARVCLGSGFGWAPPLLAGVLGCACLCARSACTQPLLAGVCVLGLGFWLHPATPGWGVGLCVFVCVLRLYPATPGWGVRCARVCLGSGFGCAPPLLAGLCGVGVCAWALVSATPRHSWLGGCGVCLVVCALRLYPATPGWRVRCGCVCLGSGFGCAPQLLAGLLGFCVCSCARSACTLPLLAGVCGVRVCAWARVLAGPRLSWLGCWGVRVCVRAPLVPRHSWLGCACLGSGFGCAPPLLAGVLGCACLFACSACTPPLLARVCAVGVCVRARVSGTYPSWEM